MAKLDEILEERGKTHGDFTDHAFITQSIKEIMIDRQGGWEHLPFIYREALDMIAHKMGRILAGDPNIKDHWDDIAGYATLVSDRIIEEEPKSELEKYKDRMDELTVQGVPDGNNPYDSPDDR